MEKVMEMNRLTYVQTLWLGGRNIAVQDIRKLWVEFFNTLHICQNRLGFFFLPVSGFIHSSPKLPMKEAFILSFTALVKKGKWFRNEMSPCQRVWGSVISVRGHVEMITPIRLCVFYLQRGIARCGCVLSSVLCFLFQLRHHHVGSAFKTDTIWR